MNASEEVNYLYLRMIVTYFEAGGGHLGPQWWPQRFSGPREKGYFFREMGSIRNYFRGAWGQAHIF